jgi:hypothetical protein
MGLGILFGLGVALMSLAARWRWPAAPAWLASSLMGAGLGIAGWSLWLTFAQSPWWWGVVGVLTLALLFGSADWAISRRYGASVGAVEPESSARPARRPTAFLRAEDGGQFDIEDSSSTADTFFDVKGRSTITSKRNRHHPEGGNDAD